MAKKNSRRRLKAAQKRIATIRNKIADFDYVCSGTLSCRMMLCGKARCRCKKDPEARHGPYYDWTRREAGRFVHKMLSPAQAEIVEQAIKNYKAILELLRTWEAETIRSLEATREVNR